MHVHVYIFYLEVFANGQNRKGFLIAKSFKMTYSHIKNAASIRYCMKVNLVVITVGGNMRPKKTKSFYYTRATCFGMDKGATCSLHSIQRTGNSPDSDNVHAQLLSFLKKVSAVLERTTETHAHLISLA